MRSIDEMNKALENIELLLKSIDYQLTKLSCLISEKHEEVAPAPQKITGLLTTKQASEIFGLSEYELRRGYKEGIYPAIEIGAGMEHKKLRWRYDLLEDALK